MKKIERVLLWSMFALLLMATVAGTTSGWKGNTLLLGGGSNGQATVAANGSSGINLTTGGGKNLNLSNSTGNVTISGTFNTSGTGAGGVLFGSSTGTIQLTGDTHANRQTAAGVIGYCTTDNAYYVGNGTVAKDIFSTTCTLNGGSPAQCNATVPANANCTCTPQALTAAAAAGGCAIGGPDGGTQTTATSVNGSTAIITIICN